MPFAKATLVTGPVGHLSLIEIWVGSVAPATPQSCHFFAQILPATTANHYILVSASLSGLHTMNAPSELNFEDMLRIRVEVLRRDHRDLDDAVRTLEQDPLPDQLSLRRLKKQKLALKDQIVRIEDRLIPDIIA